MKVLFLLKKKMGYGGTYDTIESGLLNSARMTMEELQRLFMIDTKLVVCVDGNSVDRELFLFKPDVCIIEAIWVTPDKLRLLTRLHPKVKFVIRIHSEVPFLSNEGNSVAWCIEYADIPNVKVAFNSYFTAVDFQDATCENFYYLPNIYKMDDDGDDVEYQEVEQERHKRRKVPHLLHVGCFGAIRPMKNQLQQAFAAINFANKHDSVLYFHMNTSRVEQQGHAVLKNIRSLFCGSPHYLEEHGWLDRKQFLNLVSVMDVGMQVSLNESFNIVTADFISQNVPIVVSSTISWMPRTAKVFSDKTNDIITVMDDIFENKRQHIKANRRYLLHYNIKAVSEWYRFLNRL